MIQMYIRIQILVPAILGIFECLEWLFADDVAFEPHFKLCALLEPHFKLCAPIPKIIRTKQTR